MLCHSFWPSAENNRKRNAHLLRRILACFDLSKIWTKRHFLLTCLSLSGLVLPCLLLLLLVIRPSLAGSATLGWVTAIGAVFVIVVMVAAGIIRVDMIKLVWNSFVLVLTIRDVNKDLELALSCFVYKYSFTAKNRRFKKDWECERSPLSLGFGQAGVQGDLLVGGYI